MKVLFISYVDVTSNDSGSGVRPARMLAAFKAAGHEVTALTGSQTAPERKKHVSEIAGLLDTASFDLCYIESPVYPIMRRADRKLIKKIHQKGIPTGFLSEISGSFSKKKRVH